MPIAVSLARFAESRDALDPPRWPLPDQIWAIPRNQKEQTVNHLKAFPAVSRRILQLEQATRFIVWTSRLKWTRRSVVGVT